MSLATRASKKKVRKLSRLVKPEDMTVEAWQVALRQEYAKEQRFRLRNMGAHPVFSEFSVTNPLTRRTYTVTIRGLAAGRNGCTCPDFGINTLGTCKHIEYVLTRVSLYKGARKALRTGFQPPYSEISLRYGSRRDVVCTLGTDASADLAEHIGRCFDEDGVLRAGASQAVPDLLTRAAQEGWDLRCTDAALDFLAQLRDADYRRRHLQEQYHDRAQPELLKTRLYPYQWEGALFAAAAGRALLGDEMGLGKTIQALAYVELMAREFNADRVL
ncbi:MAG: ATP-dependent helicase, partial [Candidatus Xenobia bacterium]